MLNCNSIKIRKESRMLTICTTIEHCSRGISRYHLKRENSKSTGIGKEVKLFSGDMINLSNKINAKRTQTIK